MKQLPITLNPMQGWNAENTYASTTQFVLAPMQSTVWFYRKVLFALDCLKAIWDGFSEWFPQCVGIVFSSQLSRDLSGAGNSLADPRRPQKCPFLSVKALLLTLN